MKTNLIENEAGFVIRTGSCCQGNCGFETPYIDITTGTAVGPQIRWQSNAAARIPAGKLVKFSARIRGDRVWRMLKIEVIK